MNTYLLPIADLEPLRWIVTEQRTAFPSYREREAFALNPGDRLLLYTTRGCFRNPTRDRGRVAGEAIVMSRPTRLRRPVTFGNREFPLGVEIRIERLAHKRDGVELAPLVGQLATFSGAKSWAVRMRRALVPLQAKDVGLIRRKLRASAEPYPDALDSYVL